MTAYAAAALLLAAGASTALALTQGPETPGPPGARSHSQPSQAGFKSARFSLSGRYIIGLERSVDHPAAVAEAQTESSGGDLGFVYRHAVYGYSATRLSKEDVVKLRSNPRVKYVVPDQKVEAQAQETPDGLKRTYAAENPALKINEADDLRVDADVAVIDTGISYTHPELNVVARVDCVPTNELETAFCAENSGTDGGGHGTHVAGTIGAIDNGVGVVGMAPGARLWSVRVLNNEGIGYTSWVIAGIEWVTAHASAIEVANMSLGGEGRSIPEEQAIAASQNLGVVYVVAAGNAARNAEWETPANDPEVITVSALADSDGKPGGLGNGCSRGPDDGLASFSNWGKGVDIAAPGTCVRSTWPVISYGILSGTSMATPHVSGAAAVLAAEKNPNSRSDVFAIRNALVDGGSLNWNDTSDDSHSEPLLYAGFPPLSEPEASTGGFSTTPYGSALLYGAVNPHKQAGEYYFEYGSTTGYGKKASLNPALLPAGTAYKDVSAGIAGLLPDSLYHYRLVLKSKGKTVYGADHTFRTSYWTNQSPTGIPVSTAGEWLNDVSCSAPGSCMAVGHYYNGDNYLSSYQLSGGQWTFRPVPLPTWAGVVGFAELDGVSCFSANSCVATGKVQMGGDVVVPLAESWNGSAWTTESVPAPAGSSYARLQDISCIAARTCMAVGYYKNSAGKWVNFSERLVGSTWEQLPTPNPEGSTESFLKDLSCSSPTFCMAVGFSNGSGGARSLTWDGAAWTLVPRAHLSGTDTGVSCTSSQFCMTVSSYPYAETWNGEKWSTREWTGPSGIEWAWLNSVSCTSSSHCVAVGEVHKESRRSSFAENWDNGTWTPQTGQRNADLSSTAYSVSCAAKSVCASVGSEQLEQERLLIETTENMKTAAATEVTPTSATLEGVVNPEGTATSYHFEYGPTEGYGSTIGETAVGSGYTPIVVSQKLEELPAETNLHYRLVIAYEGKIRFGEDRVVRTGTLPPHWGLKIGGATLNRPRGLAVDREGNLWVADCENNRVRKFGPNGEQLLSFGGAGSGAGQFSCPSAIAFTADGKLWVTDSGNDRVQKFDASGNYLGQFGSYGLEAGKFVEPRGIAIAANGDIWVSDYRYGRVEQFSASGTFIRAVGATQNNANGQTEFLSPNGIAISADGRIWVADQGHNTVKIISPTGQYLGRIGDGSGGGEALGELKEPAAIAIKPSGDILVTDRQRGRVSQFEQSGAFVYKFGPGDQALDEQEGIAVGPRGVVYLDYGNLYTGGGGSAGVVEKWSDPSPEVFTGGATGLSDESAEITAAINPRGYETSYHFEYGNTTAYGSKAPATNEAIGSGSNVIQVSKVLTGLNPETVYHYRVVATNGEMTSFGDDRTFTTGIPTKLSHMAVTEPFNGTTSAVSNFATTWSALSWTGGMTPKGENTYTGWKPAAGYPIVTGAAYAPDVVDTGTGTAAVATMAQPPLFSKRYFSLWLDMPSSGVRSGYELRFTEISIGTFEVTLSKWQAGVQSVLATKAGYLFAPASSLAIVARSGTVSAWTDTGGGFQQLISATDSTFSSGLAGVAGSGQGSHLTNFKVGQLLEPAAGIDAALGDLALTASFATDENPLSGGGAWGALSWDNSTSGHNTGRVNNGWRPYDSYPVVNGAYWIKGTLADTGAGGAAAGRLTWLPTVVNQYFSLDLNSPAPATTHSGYELRFTLTGANLFTVALLKWQSGVQTVLASAANQPLAIGTQLALVDRGGVVSAWKNPGSGYIQILSAADSTFTSGYSGLEGSGPATHIKEFRSGPLAPF